MNYKTIHLTLDKDEARAQIARRVPEARVKETDGQVEFRTNSGLLLAVLSDARDGEGTKLRYRTAIIGSHLVHGRTMAQRIRAAVESYKRDPG